jgi:quercetin dioxygenase-like cupin family protein
MENIHINEIEELLDGISNPETIIALPLSIEKYFTLFFVIVPQEQEFNWHDHPKMTGFTKCVHGKLKITAMDKNYLKQ